MKLLEKLKNTFFEEEYIEVEEPEKEEVVAKKLEPKEVKKEVRRENKREEVDEESEVEKPVIHYSDNELTKVENKITYFEEEDFIEPEMSIEEKKEEKVPKVLYGQTADKIYDSIYTTNQPSNGAYGASKNSFKPTPIISPIYGILDKNYRKEEVIDKRPTSSYVSRKNVDLDSIRRKAYGDLDPIEEINQTYQALDNNESVEKEEDLLYDMSNDNMPVVDQVTIADAEEYFEDLGLEYNIDYKDNRYEKATGRRVNIKKEESQVEESIEEEDANLEDNLFDLIDSMYEDGDE